MGRANSRVRANGRGSPDRVYVDHDMSGAKRERTGLDQALAAVRTGDKLVVPKLDRNRSPTPDTSATPSPNEAWRFHSEAGPHLRDST